VRAQRDELSKNLEYTQGCIADHMSEVNALNEEANSLQAKLKEFDEWLANHE
jgi:hypothetical protein